MRILGLTVGKNEAGRYLNPMFGWMREILDGHFFYDDQSTDLTKAIAAVHGCKIVERPNGMASFVENEGRFRDSAWLAFEAAMGPHPGDWVLVIDCDEVLVTPHGWTQADVRNALELAIVNAPNAVDLLIPEIFGFDDDGTPLRRIDRLWHTIHAPRLFSYKPGGSYFVGEFGVPAVPTYVMSGPWMSTQDLELMHYGYAEKRDQEIKYARYSNRSGHSNAHVQSIMADDMTLTRWNRPYVKEMRAAWNLSTS